MTSWWQKPSEWWWHAAWRRLRVWFVCTVIWPFSQKCQVWIRLWSLPCPPPAKTMVVDNHIGIFRTALQFLCANLSLGTWFNPLIQPCLRSTECYIYLTLFEISRLFRMLLQEVWCLENSRTYALKGLTSDMFVGILFTKKNREHFMTLHGILVQGLCWSSCGVPILVHVLLKRALLVYDLFFPFFPRPSRTG